MRKLRFYKDELIIFDHALSKVFEGNIDSFRHMDIIDEYEIILDKKKESVNILITRYEALVSKIQPSEIIQEAEFSQLETSFQLFEKAYLAMKARFKRFAVFNNFMSKQGS